ncbi:nodulin-24 isoform X45 [Glycine max]|uniref:nodulin-24 isoform X45 n=1 Tax=Glycine max TaxID=3847 RepID=UPI0007193F88|nr:nodulin-24 isoform X45 [Glycine max]|eukprot:XP_014621954.1 nodulin-24 isoform X44 [Glycine max]
MGSKMAILILGLLAMLLLISSEVAARNLKEAGEAVQETNEVADAKLVAAGEAVQETNEVADTKLVAGGVVKQRNKVGYGKLVGVGGYDYGNWNGGQRSPYGTGAICMRGCCFPSSLGGCLSCCPHEWQ